MTVRNLVTGGAGFIGTNLAHRLLGQGEEVVVLDDFSRAGVQDNVRWLVGAHGRGLTVIEGDVRKGVDVRRALRGVDRVFHLAAQVAVTTSLEDPRHDFAVNAAGVLEVLEAVREMNEPPALLFTSTNKVYGGLDDLALTEKDGRYQPEEPSLAASGVSEARPLQFCSPYGCSKGAADQYVLDYAKSFGLPTVVFRMSCIYGPHQQGNEDQGWVAHFAKQVLAGKEVNIYGDGKQVRDVLFVEDLVDAMGLAMGSIGRVAGQAFNMGGGPENAVSLLEVLELLGQLGPGRAPDLSLGDWRVGDQRWYVSDTGRFQEATGWRPQVPAPEGVGRLCHWLVGEGCLAGAGERPGA